MAKKRVTGRFYVFLLLLAAIVLFLFRDSIFGASEFAVIIPGSTTDVRTVQALIVRDEQLLSQEIVTRVDYLADENTLVNQGDPICNVYSMEYGEKMIIDLNKVRKNIQSYHKVILGNELDSTLEVYDLNVKQSALNLKYLVNRVNYGNLLKLVDQLEQAMETRRDYMRANMRSDAKLIKYYDEESQKINTITSWYDTLTAPRAGVISYYTDGYETLLTPLGLDALSVDQARKVLSGESLSSEASRASVNIARVVDQHKWYLVVISSDRTWNPVVGLTYSFRMTGYEDILYSGSVVRIQKTGSYTMAQLEVNDPIGPLIYKRAGTAVLGTNLSGLTVPARAIDTVSGQTGVWLYDVPGGTFVPVEVLSINGDDALITPLTEGGLGTGSRVLIK